MTPLEQFDIYAAPLTSFPVTTGRSAEAPLGFGPMQLAPDYNEDEVRAFLACKAGIGAQRVFVNRLMQEGFWEGDGSGRVLAIGREAFDEEMDKHGWDGQPPTCILDAIETDPDTGDLAYMCPRGILSGHTGAIKVERDLEITFDGDTAFCKLWLCITVEKSLATFSAS